jgi:hypothetical protein
VKFLACTVVLAAALTGSLVRPVAAAAATPCWKTLLTDWYDGRIDNTYPLHCYQDALRHLPADVQTYSSAHDDIVRALLTAQATLKKEHKAATPTTPVPPPSGGASGDGTTTTGTTTTTSSTDTNPTPITTTTPSPGKESGKGLTHLADKLNPSNPDSLPLPLLVLGGLAILLVAAGGAGLLAKRLQGRKPSS